MRLSYLRFLRGGLPLDFRLGYPPSLCSSSSLSSLGREMNSGGSLSFDESVDVGVADRWGPSEGRVAPLAIAQL